MATTTTKTFWDGKDDTTIMSVDFNPDGTQVDTNVVIPVGYVVKTETGGARRRKRKTAKKMSKRKLKKWCKSKKNHRSKKGRKMCKK